MPQLNTNAEVLMSNSNDRHVVPTPDAKWGVKAPNGERLSATADRARAS